MYAYFRQRERLTDMLLTPLYFICQDGLSYYSYYLTLLNSQIHQIINSQTYQFLSSSTRKLANLQTHQLINS